MESNSKIEIIYEYVSALSKFLFIHILIFFATLILVYYNLECIVTLNIEKINILLKSVWENKLLLLSLVVYFYSTYEILTKKIPSFLLSTEFEKEIEKREFYIKVLFMIKEFLSNHFTLLLILLPIFYYFLKEYGIFYTILFATPLFYLVKIIGDITIKTVSLHSAIFHDYELSIDFFGLFKEKNTKVFSLENNKLHFTANLIFVFINILAIILIIKFFAYAIITYIVYEIIILLLPKDIILRIIQYITKKTK